MTQDSSQKWNQEERRGREGDGKEETKEGVADGNTGSCENAGWQVPRASGCFSKSSSGVVPGCWPQAQGQKTILSQVKKKKIVL